MCDSDDFPGPLVQEFRRARKEHRCFACREPIRPGDRYHFTAQLYDKEFDTFKHCLRCWTLIRALFAAGAYSVQWDLKCGERWEDNFGPLPEDIAALAFVTADEAQQLPEAEP